MENRAAFCAGLTDEKPYMNVMNVMPQLSLSLHGPVNKEGDLVHFRQGDLDGACGPYSLLMALVTNGVIGRDEASWMSLSDGRTRLGKFSNRLREFGGLIGNGTNSLDLDWLSSCFGREISTEFFTGNTRAIVSKSLQAVQKGRASILRVEWPGGGAHWLLIVGYQGRVIQSEENEQAVQCTHLLCLDPFVEAPVVSLWNAVIEVQDENGAVINQGPLPSNHWQTGEETRCKITGGLMIIKRGG
jgi:hypothetical protein